MTTDHNPFAPPRTPPEPSPLPREVSEAEAAAVRRGFFDHESAVKTIGSVYAIVGFLMCLFAAVSAFSLVAGRTTTGLTSTVTLCFLGLVGPPLSLSGVGLRNLWGSARITAGAVLSFPIVFYGLITHNWFVMLSQVVFLYYLGCPAGRYVCSEEYRDIVSRVPHAGRRSWFGVVFVVVSVLLTLGTLIYSVDTLRWID